MSNETYLPSQPSVVEPKLPPLDALNANDLFHWVRMLWPALLVVLGGGIFFGPEIVNSIQSTPHPALVYIIFGVCAIAIAVCIQALAQYLRETRVARRWLKMSNEMRDSALRRGVDASVFTPVYRLLSTNGSMDPVTRQVALNSEMEAGQEHLEARLELPHFLGGALVGLGLVGTFVGLLGTLDDLSKVFSALVNSGASTVSPTQMFTDMVGKLQAPMRGMGTAFVASLYGLLGSLVVTLMLVGARKSAASALKQVHRVVRQLDYGTTSEVIPVAPVQPKAITTNVELLSGDPQHALRSIQTAVEEMGRQFESSRLHHEQLTLQNAKIMQEMLTMVQSMSTQQGQLHQGLQAQLQEFRQVLVQDRANLMSVLQTTRQDTVETVKAIDACRSSFEQSSRGLRAVLAFMEPN